MNVNIVTELGPQSNSCGGSSGTASQCPAPGYVPIETHNDLYGRELRYVLTNYISRGYRTIAELVNKLAEDGFTVWGRASKVVSDALRWEVRNGRVRRIRRGLYAIDSIPRTTLHRIRTRSQSLFLLRTLSLLDGPSIGTAYPHRPLLPTGSGRNGGKLAPSGERVARTANLVHRNQCSSLSRRKSFRSAISFWR